MPDRKKESLIEALTKKLKFINGNLKRETAILLALEDGAKKLEEEMASIEGAERKAWDTHKEILPLLDGPDEGLTTEEEFGDLSTLVLIKTNLLRDRLRIKENMISSQDWKVKILDSRRILIEDLLTLINRVSP